MIRMITARWRHRRQPVGAVSWFLERGMIKSHACTGVGFYGRGWTPACSVKPAACYGFTLVELLITTSLMALVGGATVASLAGGVKVWERAAEFGVDDQAALIAFTRMRRDLHNARRFHPIPFAGAYDQYTFAAADRNDPAASDLEEIGRLGYFLNERRHLLCRSFVPYRLMRGTGVTDRCQVMLEHVERVRCRYVGIDATSGQNDWTDHWQSQDPPVALTCEVTLSRSPKPTVHSLVVYLGHDDENESDAK